MENILQICSDSPAWRWSHGLQKEEKIKKDKIDIEKMQEIMDSLEETENIGTDDAIFKWIDNLDLEEEEKEIQ